MSRRSKLIIPVLVIVLVALAAAVVRFYLSVPDNISGGGSQTDIVRRLSSDADGNKVFEDSSGMCGVIDSGNRVIIAPEWLELTFTGNETCIASRRIGGRILTGCVDFDGSMTVPFIYSSITKHTAGETVFYIAEADADGQYVIYSRDFVPVFRQSWSGAEFSGDELTLIDAGGKFTYVFGDEGGMTMKNARVSGTAMTRSYTLDVSSRVLLQKLTPSMLEEIAADTSVYLEYAFTGNDDLLSELTTGSRGGFQTLFPDDHKILEKKLKGIKEIYLYSSKTDDGTPGFAVSVTADTELTYSDETDGVTKTLRDCYTAVIKFAGWSVSDLSAAAGSFLETDPDYPDSVPVRAAEADDTPDIPDIPDNNAID
ncbi:MAG: hypothetical protein IJ737_01440 [Ruminococcus sp.]|nr:hypothetical protein [Ruminococcus sp.]MBR2282964.1 hypothetical protein [Ruminococcus sp.]